MSFQSSGDDQWGQDFLEDDFINVDDNSDHSSEDGGREVRQVKMNNNAFGLQESFTKSKEQDEIVEDLFSD
jgi:hypothetical protein